MKTKTQQIAIAILMGSFIIMLGIILSSIITRTNVQNEISTDPKEIYQNISFVKIDASPTLGYPDAPVTIVEYTDFNCPVCRKAFEEILPQLKKEYIDTKKVKFVFKSHPIVGLPDEGKKKAEAAYCAYAQGGNEAFFTYHDALYTSFSVAEIIASEQSLIGIARKQQLDIDSFTSCIGSRTYKNRVIEEDVEANIIGSHGTPTWLIGRSNGNGIKDTIKTSGLQQYSVFKIIIDKFLE